MMYGCWCVGLVRHCIGSESMVRGSEIPSVVSHMGRGRRRTLIGLGELGL